MKTFDLIETPLEGTNLIEASAGTGKTFAIAGIFLRLILEKQLDVGSILVVTFTNAAAAELRTRIRSRLKSARDSLVNEKYSGFEENDPLTQSILERFAGTERDFAVRTLSSALLKFDEASISTIHSFCSEALARFAFESGSLFTTEFTSDSQRFTSEAAADYWREKLFTLPEIILNSLPAEKFNPAHFEKFIKAWGMGGLKLVPAEKFPSAEETARNLKEFEKEFLSARGFWLENIDALSKEINEYNRSDLKKILKFQSNHASSRLRANDYYFSIFDPLFPEKDIKLKYFTYQDTDRKMLPANSLFKKFAIITDKLIPLIDSSREVMNRFLTALNIGAIEYARKRIPDLKKRYDLRAFDDLISDTRAALSSPAGAGLALSLRTRFRAALIDEFQDTDSVQYEIFTKIFETGDSSLFLIGDPKQAIYAFRGADIFSYMTASESVEERHTLGTNHRSHPDLVAAVNGLFSAVKNPFLFEQIRFEPVDPSTSSFERFTLGGKDVNPLKIYMIPPDSARQKPDAPLTKSDAGESAAEFTAADISILLNQALAGKALIGLKPVAPSDIAVLTRTHKQAEQIKNKLARYSVPSVIYGEHSVFDTRQADDLLALMRGAANPSDLPSLKRALAALIAGRGAAEIKLINTDDALRDEITARFNSYRQEWSKRGFMSMIQMFMSAEDTRRKILSRPDGERILTDFLHLAELLHSYETKEGLGIERLTARLAEKINSQDKERSEDNQLRLETDETAVKIVTIHSSKGLQYPIVYIPFAFHSKRYELNPPKKLHDPQTREPLLAVAVPNEDGEMARLNDAGAVEELAEEMRILYVAMTRARYAVNLFWGKITLNARLTVNPPFASAMSYLFHSDNSLPAEQAISDLDARLNAYTHERVRGETILRAKEACAEVITLTEKKGIIYIPKVSSNENKPAARKFSGIINPSFSVTSYSGLLSSRSFEYDEGDKSDAAQPPSDFTKRNIFTFPKGASAGSCVHQIFERAGFADADISAAREEIISSLTAYNFSVEWAPSLDEMFSRTVNFPLKTDSGEEIILSSLSPSEYIHELEFYFPAVGVTADGIERLIFSEISRSSPSPETEAAAAGYLRGFIDLIFKHKGRYYIIDWKSNHLGYTREDYSAENISREMRSAGYMIQYHIYAAALDRWLTASIKNYDYEKNFGGVFYLFVRGIGPGTGIYFDRPEKNLIDELNLYFSAPQTMFGTPRGINGGGA